MYCVLTYPLLICILSTNCYETFIKLLQFSDDKDINVPINDDAFLKKFLRPRKYYPESAYELVSFNSS